MKITPSILACILILFVSTGCKPRIRVKPKRFTPKPAARPNPARLRRNRVTASRSRFNAQNRARTGVEARNRGFRHPETAGRGRNPAQEARNPSRGARRTGGNRNRRPDPSLFEITPEIEINLSEDDRRR